MEMLLTANTVGGSTAVKQGNTREGIHDVRDMYRPTYTFLIFTPMTKKEKFFGIIMTITCSFCWSTAAVFTIHIIWTTVLEKNQNPN